MNIALVVLTTLLGLAATASALGKYSMNPNVVEMLRGLGLRERQIRLLGTVELLGALGLLVGIWFPMLGLLAAIGFVLYFLGAVIAHLRVRDALMSTAPAIVLLALSIAVAVLEYQR
jgi:hypothetical protein